MTLLKVLGKEGLKRFNEILKNTDVVDRPKKKSNNDDFDGNDDGICNAFNKCVHSDIKAKSTT